MPAASVTPNAAFLKLARVAHKKRGAGTPQVFDPLTLRLIRAECLSANFVEKRFMFFEHGGAEVFEHIG